MKIALSPLDTNRFGIVTARANEIKLKDIESVMQYCKDNLVEFLIARCNVADTHVCRVLLSQKFELMETQVSFVHDLKEIKSGERSDDIIIREALHHEDSEVADVSYIGFTSYPGHYHMDNRLDIEKCRQTYKDWAYRACHEKHVADKVYVAVESGKIIGFFAARLNDGAEGEAILSSILPEYQGKGIYRSFILKAMEWSKENGAKRFITGTQIFNIAVQKVWARLGFDPMLDKSFYTFHKWFN